MKDRWSTIEKEAESLSTESKLLGDCLPILDKVLSYPSVVRKEPKKNKKLSLPKHLTSADSLKILESLDTEKRREEDEKEARRILKAKQKEENIIKKVTEKKIIKEGMKAKKTKKAKTKKSTFKKKMDKMKRECEKCGGLYDENDIWVQCSNCEDWMHARCTNLHKKTQQQINQISPSWSCEVCR